MAFKMKYKKGGFPYKNSPMEKGTDDDELMRQIIVEEAENAPRDLMLKNDDVVESAYVEGTEDFVNKRKDELAADEGYRDYEHKLNIEKQNQWKLDHLKENYPDLSDEEINKLINEPFVSEGFTPKKK